MSDEIIAMNMRIEGQVQGCGFRDFAVRAGQAYGLIGWVRNRGDGSVEALACGPQKHVEGFIGACMKGPSGARVTAFNLEPADFPKTANFVRHPTL